MSSASISLPAADLVDIVARVFAACGVDGDRSRTVAESLVESDLEGLSSHGVMLVDMYVARLKAGSVAVGGEPELVSDRGATVVLDAGNALGQLTGDTAIELAVERARQYGVSLVAVRNGFHFGAARRYAVAAARQDCFGIAMCNTRPLMPAPGGAERVVGNNPVAIAIPADGPVPLVLDMAMSEAAMGKIRMAAKSGAPIPDTWAVAEDGSPTTDPREAISGMLLPMAGPKGFGLAFMIDLLCGLLSGGGYGDTVQPLYGDYSVPYNCSHVFVAIDAAHFGDRSSIRAAATKAAERVRTGRRAPGADRLFTPGEPEWDRRKRAAGAVVLNPEVVRTLVTIARDLGVTAPLSIHPDVLKIMGS